MKQTVALITFAVAIEGDVSDAEILKEAVPRHLEIASCNYRIKYDTITPRIERIFVKDEK